MRGGLRRFGWRIRPSPRTPRRCRTAFPPRDEATRWHTKYQQSKRRAEKCEKRPPRCEACRLFVSLARMVERAPIPAVPRHRPSAVTDHCSCIDVSRHGRRLRLDRCTSGGAEDDGARPRVRLAVSAGPGGREGLPNVCAQVSVITVPPPVFSSARLRDSRRRAAPNPPLDPRAAWRPRVSLFVRFPRTQRGN